MDFRCKTCGGIFSLSERIAVVKCEYCGVTQTIPMVDNEKRDNLFNRANELRIAGEFDKSMAIYEKIVEEDNTDAEAYWGLVLSKFGIEYVKDPTSNQWTPTCHRSSYDWIVNDVDFLAVCKHSEGSAKNNYIKKAKEIARIQKKIIDIAKSEPEFDVFICYKETDSYGRRTPDSVIANDIYHHLTNEGFKVFYAAITLEDKLGQDYEPYIFAALNTSKVLLSIGTKPEYYNAVWVKNEWSRFLELMKQDTTKTIIPCFRDMNPYDLPNEFVARHLQSQDMGKIGFINDLVRGIKKIINPENKDNKIGQYSETANLNTLKKRIEIFLTDKEWKQAKEYCQKGLDLNPSEADFYIYDMLAKYQVSSLNELSKIQELIDKSKHYHKALRFSNDEQKELLKKCSTENRYFLACDILKNAHNKDDINNAMKILEAIQDHKKGKELYDNCDYYIKIINNNRIYNEGLNKFKKAEYFRAAELFSKISGHLNADELFAKAKYNNEKTKAIDAEIKQKKQDLVSVKNALSRAYKMAETKTFLYTALFLILSYAVAIIASSYEREIHGFMLGSFGSFAATYFLPAGLTFLFYIIRESNEYSFIPKKYKISIKTISSEISSLEQELASIISQSEAEKSSEATFKNFFRLPIEKNEHRESKYDIICPSCRNKITINESDIHNNHAICSICGIQLELKKG